MISKFINKNDNLHKKIAFTLAEVLITLGIIGVVAALTLPTLIQKNQERIYINRLTQTVSILSQATRLAEVKCGDISSWISTSVNEGDIYSTEGLADLRNCLLPYLKVAKDCGINDENNECMGTYKTLNGASNFNDIAHDSRYYKIQLFNGASVDIRGTSEAEVPKKILFAIHIDVNGPKPPNVLGRDLFHFKYLKNEGLLPQGHPKNPSSSECSLENDGYACSYEVYKNKSMKYLH